MAYRGSYIWSLRERVGHQELLVPGAQVILLDDEQALFQRRSDTGEWEIPAGSAEPGQSFTDTAIAEVREEIGLHLDPNDLVPFATFSHPVDHRLVYPSGDVVHAFALCFVAERWTGTPSVGPDEVIEWNMFNLSSPPEPLRHATEQVLSLYQAYASTGQFQAA